MPSPMQTSQAATVITMIARICPSPLPHMRENAISARLAPLSISSRQSSTTSGLRRTITPKAPVQKTIAERARYQPMLTSRLGSLPRPSCRCRAGAKRGEPAARPPLRAARQQHAPTAAINSSKGASNTSKKRVSSRLPMYAGVPNARAPGA